MNYKEAEKLAYQVEWKTTLCHVGKECWCRCIEPKKKIKYKEDENDEDFREFYLIGDGSVNKELANYIVKLHNEKLKMGK